MNNDVNSSSKENREPFVHIVSYVDLQLLFTVDTSVIPESTELLQHIKSHAMSYNQTMSTGMNSRDEREESFFSAHYSVLAVSAVLGSVMLGVVSFWLREVCYDRFGIEFCSGTIATARRREIRRFQLRAMQLQRQMERDLLDSSVTQQKERKRKYGAFLQKFCKVREKNGAPIVNT